MAEQNTFVPSGVDAGTWMGFEQRIRRRRFAALVDQFEQAVAEDNRDAAQAALDEARELRPDAPEVRAAVEQLALLQARPDMAPAAHAWSRVFGAVALLLIGVSLLIGLDWMHTGPSAPEAMPAATTQTRGDVQIPDLVVVNPEPEQEPVASAPVSVANEPVSLAAPRRAPQPPTRWNRVLKLFGVEVIHGTATSGVRLRKAI